MENIKKYLGIDWGEKRIGLATADSEVGLALPLKTVANLAEVLSAAKEEETDIIVLGMPKKMSGAAADNPLWLNFLEQLKSHSGRMVVLADERLTSQAAKKPNATRLPRP
jgi:putative Holliday junction resolvase